MSAVEKHRPALQAIANGERAAVIPDDMPESTWTPVDLGPVLDGTWEPEVPTIALRTDGVGLFYPNRIACVFGEPEAGKGWVVLTACAEILEGGGKVVYVDFEDSAESVIGRLKAMGVDVEALRERLVYIRPDEAIGDAGRAELLAVAEGASLAVIDGVTESLALEGLSMGDNDDAAKWLARIARPLQRIGVPAVIVDHIAKNKEGRNDRYMIGGQHKLAGIDVAYRVEVVEPFGRGKSGSSKLFISKDRPGYVRGKSPREPGRPQLAAEFHMTSYADDSVSAELRAPGGAKPWRPSLLMERVSKTVEDERGITATDIKERTRGNAQHIVDALNFLIEDGYVRRERAGPKRTEHASIREYRMGGDE